MLATISSTRTVSGSNSGDCAGRSTESVPINSPSKRMGTHKKLTSSQSFGGRLMDAVLESRLLGDPRNDHRLGGLDDQADDAFAGAIAGIPHRRRGDAVGRFDEKLLAVRQQQHHRSAEHSQPPLQNGQDRSQQLLGTGLLGDQIGDFSQDVQVRFVLLQMWTPFLADFGFHALPSSCSSSFAVRVGIVAEAAAHRTINA